MKLKLTPKQLLLLINLGQLKKHPITISGESARRLNQYLLDNDLTLRYSKRT